jgi:GNAT superfamily N-acetyltransferase
MPALEIQPFAHDHLDAAADLLAERHIRHRQVEPLLPDTVDFREQIERELDGGAGVAALKGSELVGYLLGRRGEDQVGPHIWSYIAGHAVRDPELTRDLYAAAAGAWVEDGLTRHFVYVPALPELIEPWFRLSFGASAALGTRETAGGPASDDSVVVRDGVAADIEAAARLDRAMGESMLPAPSFSNHHAGPLEEVVEEWQGTWDDTDTYKHFVAERDGRVVGHILLYRRPPDLRVPSDSIDLAQASTEPDLRGSGIGLALTTHVLNWAHENGFPTMVTDWRMTNLFASRFWPKRGFRETFLRLYRSIP